MWSNILVQTEVIEYHSTMYIFTWLNILVQIYIYILVCYTNIHLFFKHECQHIFRKHTYIFQSPKNDNMEDSKLCFTESIA